MTIEPTTMPYMIAALFGGVSGCVLGLTIESNRGMGREPSRWWIISVGMLIAICVTAVARAQGALLVRSAACGATSVAAYAVCVWLCRLVGEWWFQRQRQERCREFGLSDTHVLLHRVTWGLRRRYPEDHGTHVFADEKGIVLAGVWIDGKRHAWIRVEKGTNATATPERQKAVRPDGNDERPPIWIIRIADRDPTSGRSRTCKIPVQASKKFVDALEEKMDTYLVS
ncbi:MAG: hypothetical protein V4813_13035 [Gemmatimonadota bacterium]